MSRWLLTLLTLSAVTIAVLLAIARPGALSRHGTLAQPVAAVSDTQPNATPTITPTPTTTATPEPATHKRATRTPTPEPATATPVPPTVPPPPPPPPAMPTPSGGVGPEIVAPTTGSGPTGSGDSWALWLAAGLAGAALAAGGFYIRYARSDR
jgi:hypothetical protein